jgi:two-component system, NarL family, sensor histidine kinase DesK
MTAAVGSQATGPLRWLLVVTHVSVISWPVVVTTLGVGTLPPTYPHPVPPALTGLAILAVQLRHSFAAARGERPRAGMWTLLLLAALAYVPMPWFGYLGWWITQAFLVASAPMVLRGRAGFLTAAALATLATVMTLRANIDVTPKPTTAELAYDAYGGATIIAALGASLYGVARLVRVLDELAATRTELAELAVGRERLRISRDLHDLLGQSLSAISLKGDLAIRLLSTDAQAARAEIESLTTVARDALRGVRAIPRNEHLVSLRTELDGAAALLSAAGIIATVQAFVPDLPPPVEHTVAWAVREGVANILRHSAARTCSIIATEHDGLVRLEIINDGAGPPDSQGRGLTGLTERAHALSGTVAAARIDGRFRLLVQIPTGG